MTDLLSRPPHVDPADRGGRSRHGRLRTLATAAWTGLRGTGEERTLSGAAALAALGAVGAGLGACMVVALVGWFAADAGAHGSTTDALRVGADVWLLGHGARLSIGGAPFGIVPLALPVALAWLLHRLARRAATTARPTRDDRTVLQAATVLTGLYLVATVVVCVLAGNEAVTPGLGRAILGSLVLSGLAGTLGLARGSGRLQAWLDRVPGWVRAVAHGAAASCAGVLAAAAALTLVMVVLGLNEAVAVLSGLRLGTGDYLAYGVATLLLLPNAVLLAAAYLVGPGFAVGTGTIVSPGVVTLGPVPAFPLLAGLPAAGPTPAWTMALLAVPVLAAAWGAGRAQRAYAVSAWDSAALRGFGSGLLGALLLTALVGLAGGPLGTGRMADVGASVMAVGAAAVASMALAGLVAGLGVAWWQRRR
ncbi:hypothetical protein SAMN04488570_1673 [Nocardioides scoriae]|uniref:Integral membrane protein n=1 Tax=Nocardioides scoriae TaxID=642780 RepID=A0A1H1RFC4_9ACTN|nr:DUF6350 family protein [Nocardioides scoriae]SDS34451.1 hypothetical protein SAMN04488570_1673 [Nocardioides scoriae]